MIIEIILWFIAGAVILGFIHEPLMQILYKTGHAIDVSSADVPESLIAEWRSWRQHKREPDFEKRRQSMLIHLMTLMNDQIYLQDYKGNKKYSGRDFVELLLIRVEQIYQKYDEQYYKDNPSWPLYHHDSSTYTWNPILDEHDIIKRARQAWEHRASKRTVTLPETLKEKHAWEHVYPHPFEFKIPGSKPKGDLWDITNSDAERRARGEII